MTPKIPDYFMGKPIKGAMDRVLSSPESQIAEPILSPQSAPNQSGYIYVPSIGLYVAEQKTLHNIDWYTQQNELHSQGLQMPTPYEFFKFVKYLKDNPSIPNQDSILDEIVTVRPPWRAENLDAYFTKENNKWYMSSNHRTINGQLKAQTKQELKDALREDRTPGISLDYLLDNMTGQGLPTTNTPDGDLYYWHPRDKAVARFGAVAVRSYLGCGRDPRYSGAGLGVRAAKKI